MADEVDETSMTTHRLRACRMMLDYSAMEQNIAGLVESSDHFAELIQDHPESCREYLVAEPTIRSCIRRLRVLAASMERLASKIEGVK